MIPRESFLWTLSLFGVLSVTLSGRISGDEGKSSLKEEPSGQTHQGEPSGRALQEEPSGQALHDPREVDLHHVEQLTSGGENAEAYFSFDGQKLIFQSTREDQTCDQIYILELRDRKTRRVSTGLGRTTCSYFYPDGDRILYASTHWAQKECPSPPSFQGGYAWPIFESYDIFGARSDGSDLKRLTRSLGYDAEATVSPIGDKIVFTSARDGDLELYTMRLDGSDQKRLTHIPGYDGGAFFSPDGKKIVFRGNHPEDSLTLARDQELLRKGLVAPKSLELFLMDADGSHLVQLTHNGAINFCPFFHPSGEWIVFASNQGNPRGMNFDLYLIRIDGTDQKRVTYHETFDAFPVFSPDGKKLVFASNRNSKKPGETNIFIADWNWDSSP